MATVELIDKLKVKFGVGSLSNPTQKIKGGDKTYRCVSCATDFVNTPGYAWYSYRDSVDNRKHVPVCHNCLNGHVEVAPVVSTPDVSEEEIVAVETSPVAPLSDITDKIVTRGKHFLTPLIVKVLHKRKYPFLFGAPGAGKTHLCMTLAQDMAIEFVIISMSPDMLKSELFGSVSPLTGNYNGTAFRRAWENGGLILLDEVALTPGALTNVLNAGLAQKVILFPDGALVPMHNDCMIIFADNSNLRGNDPLFPERQDVGEALRDRLTYIDFVYDESLELRVIKSFTSDIKLAVQWHNVVKQLRKDLKPLMVPVFASPRFAYAGIQWLEMKLPFEQIVNMELLKGQTPDIIAQVMPVINRVLVSSESVKINRASI